MPAPVQQYTVLLSFEPSTITSDLGSVPNDDNYALLLDRLTSHRVLNTTFANPRVATLPRMRTAEDPLLALRHAITKKVVVQPPAPLLVVSLTVVAASLHEAKIISEATIASIRSEEQDLLMARAPYPPTGQMVLGEYSWGPLDEPWKVVIVVAVCFFTLVGALYPRGGRGQT